MPVLNQSDESILLHFVPQPISHSILITPANLLFGRIHEHACDYLDLYPDLLYSQRLSVKLESSCSSQATSTLPRDVWGQWHPFIFLFKGERMAIAHPNERVHNGLGLHYGPDERTGSGLLALHLYVVVSQRLARGPESRLKLELTSPKSKSNKSHIFIGHWSPGQALCRRQHNHGCHADSWRPSDCSLQLLLASKAEMCRTWSIATDSSLGPVCHPNTATTDWPL